MAGSKHKEPIGSPDGAFALLVTLCVGYSPHTNSDWSLLLKMSNQTTRAGGVVHDLLEAVDRIRSLIEEHADSAETNRQLSGVVYDAMYQAGLFAMLAPKAHGGLELHPVEAMRVWEAVARIDLAAAWNLVMNQAISAYAAWLPPEGAREVFHHGPATTAGAFNPPGTGTRVDGGWRITGRLPFGSGCHQAQWLAMPVVGTDGDRPLLDPATGQPKTFAAFFPRSAATILDTWHTFGMRGTGSTDFAVQDLFVPDRLTAPICPLEKPAPGFEGPLFRMWPWTAILGEATVSVGIAAAAVDAAVRLCKTKTPAYNAIPLREQQLTQFQMGKAKGPRGSITRHALLRRRRGVRRNSPEQDAALVGGEGPLAARGIIRGRSLR